MGQRQHADVDCDKKRLSKIEKCESSTSAKLGVRLCGMQVESHSFHFSLDDSSCLQVYQVDSNRYKFTDKYRGRSLTSEGFRSTLLQYFDNGRTQRFDVLPALIERLKALRETIASLVRYRFYGGSLLIVYDGSLQSNSVDVRMIDFANTSRMTPADDALATETVGPDHGYLLGIECLLGVFQSLQQHDSSP